MARSLRTAGHRQGTRYSGRPLTAKAECPWSALTDEDLLTEYVQKGTPEAFAELVHRYERPLYSYLRRYLGNAGLAEEAFQTTFLQVHLHCRQFAPSRRFRPWVYRIATTQAIDLLRRNRAHKLVSLDARRQSGDITGGDWLPDDLPDARAQPPLEQLETTEDGQRLRLMVDALPPRMKTVLVLVMFHGLGYQDAAKELGIPLGTVKSRLHHAILNLRKNIGVAA